jgi:hypothetical protein
MLTAFICDHIIYLRYKHSKKAAILVLILVVTFIYTKHGFNLIESSSLLMSDMLSYGPGSTQLTQYMHSYNIQQYIMYLPLSMVRFLLTPLPWQVSGSFIWLLPGQIIWYFLFCIFIYGIYNSTKNYFKESLWIYITIGMTVMIYSFTLTVSGARHRIQLIAFLAIFVAIGLKNIYKIKYVLPIFMSFIFITTMLYEILF